MVSRGRRIRWEREMIPQSVYGKTMHCCFAESDQNLHKQMNEFRMACDRRQLNGEYTNDSSDDVG